MSNPNSSSPASSAGSLSRWRNFRAYGWREFVLLVSVGALTACLWSFVAITEEMHEQEHHETENALMLALRDPADLHRPIGPSWVTSASLDVTALGGASVLTILTILVLGFLVLQRRFGAAGLLFGATVGGTLLSQGLKHLINRDRPNAVPHLAEISNSSYPSGHSMLSAIVYLTLAAVLAQTIENRRGKIYIVVAALALAFLVGVSRVIIGVHYPSDVLAGWTAGIGWAALCWLVGHWFQSRGMLRK
jgi:undecaprenyl-diphosphatase